MLTFDPNPQSPKREYFQEEKKCPFSTMSTASHHSFINGLMPNLHIFGINAQVTASRRPSISSSLLSNQLWRQSQLG